MTKQYWLSLLTLCLVLSLLSAPARAEPGLHEVGPSAPAARTAVIFVHGVLGSSETTWKNGKTNAYWPALMRADAKTFGEADIYVYDYPTRTFGQAQAVYQLAQELNIHLKSLEEKKYQHFVFVAHSMGGLIVRSLLRNDRDRWTPYVRAVFYLGTPADGAQIATLGRVLSRNPQFIDLTPLASTANHWLGDMNDWWRRNPPPFKTFCAYETKGMRIAFLRWKTVVPHDSAIAACSNDAFGADADHAELSKPRHVRDTLHLWLAQHYAELKLAFPNQWDISRARASLRPELSERFIRHHPHPSDQESTLRDVLKIAASSFAKAKTGEEDAASSDLNEIVKHRLDAESEVMLGLSAGTKEIIEPLLAKGDLAGARKRLLEMIQKVQADVAPFVYKVALLDLARADFAQARRGLLHAMVLDPNEGKYALELGRLEESLTDRDAARTAMQDAARRYRSANDLAGQAEAAMGLFRVEVESRNFDAADGFFGEARTLYTKLTDRAGLAQAWCWKGKLAKQRHQPTEAKSAFNEALALAAQSGDIATRVKTTNALGDLARQVRDYAEAKKHYANAIELLSASPDNRSLAHAYLGLARAERDSNEHDAALAHLAIAAERYDALHSRRGLADVHLCRAQIRLARSEDDAARRDVDEAMIHYEAVKATVGQANAWLARGNLAIRAGRFAEAHEHLNKSMGMFQRTNGKEGRADVLLAMGRLARKESALDLAKATLTQALELYQELRDPVGEGNVRQELNALAASTPEQPVAQSSL